MRLSKEFVLKNFASIPEAMASVSKIKGDFCEVMIMSEQAGKTYKQNKLFHGLLQLFWASGCSSYLSFDDMRLCYKRMAGLVKNRDGRIIEGSWSEATKEQAKFAIDSLLKEMDVSGVIGSSQGQKYQQILTKLGENYG